ncbi:MAG TPA: chemotaxis-specific protein-glutamate methyltransferase CheB [Phycisphaerae bacterium]|nr:chemotaxis-specific protein-glutamate methyltransferase CheB [Phycisphaerae bacterium]HRY66413.1 chemotaxis-specific protein-glutamate methyltransferase CheB [Phycisphaerae bacterium]HSA25879.1 chemotaxis-specific protein-glutamate methyltransferase CheB [Phycisphaerae bacterium]
MRRRGPVKVLIVDDSPLVRATLARALSDVRTARVVGAAKDPYEARDLIIAYHPDVIILDLQMPRMDGLTFLRKLTIHYPVPVIMCSDSTPAGHLAALEAIEVGALDVIFKPATPNRQSLQRLGAELADKLRAASVAIPAPPPLPVKVNPPSFRSAGLDPNRYLVVLGASTGGTDAIRQLLAVTPSDFPPIAMVQHMPAGFTASFAQHLDRAAALSVREAVDGEIIDPGTALLARGDHQMQILAAGTGLRIRYAGTDLVNRHCPSVEMLFDSAARITARKVIGVLLTGMGADGAHALLRLRQAGAVTIAQDRQSCVVYGMPKVAVDLGAAQYQCAPRDVPATIVKALGGRSPAPAPVATP